MEEAHGKLDAYSENLKEGLRHALKALKKAITEKKKQFRASNSIQWEHIMTIGFE